MLGITIGRRSHGPRKKKKKKKMMSCIETDDDVLCFNTDSTISSIDMIDDYTDDISATSIDNDDDHNVDVKSVNNIDRADNSFTFDKGLAMRRNLMLRYMYGMTMQEKVQQFVKDILDGMWIS